MLYSLEANKVKMKISLLNDLKLKLLKLYTDHLKSDCFYARETVILKM